MHILTSHQLNILKLQSQKNGHLEVMCFTGLSKTHQLVIYAVTQNILQRIAKTLAIEIHKKITDYKNYTIVFALLNIKNLADRTLKLLETDLMRDQTPTADVHAITLQSLKTNSMKCKII